MEIEIKKILIELSKLSAFIPVIVGLYYAKKLDTRFKVLLGYVLLSLFMEYFASWYGHVLKRNNMPPLHVYALIELGFLAYIFCHALFDQKRNKVFYWILGIGVIVAILNASILGSLYKMNIIFKSYETIVLVILCMIYFKKSLVILPDSEPIFKQPMYWYSTAVLIYFPVNLLFFMLFNELFENSIEILRVGMILHSLFNIVANLLYTRVFRCFRKAV